MDLKDRQRLALSAGIAVAGYALLFLLTVALKWPPLTPKQSISPPLSVYVNLAGPGPGITVKSPAAQKVSPPPAPQVRKRTPQPKATAKKAPAQVQPVAKSSTAKPSHAASATPPAARPQSSAGAPQPPASAAASAAGSAQQSTPAPPPMPTSSTSSAGPLPFSTQTQGGAAPTSPQGGGSIAGPSSQAPGVTYPAESGPGAPQGSGGSGSQSDTSGQARTYFGPTTTQGAGNFFNKQLANAAGNPSSSPAQATKSSSQASGPTSSAAAPAAGGQGAAAGSGTGSRSGGPRIVWRSAASKRQVLFEPPPLTIPKKYLDEIPPTVTLTITFRVTPSGIVQPLNVSPSLGYPELDNVLETWMGKWRFQPISGTQVARGKLEYVIQAVTAR